ncbi:MAG TPA: UDP-N-acetylmuramoyl-tripeptide--D-alanyl-D-alanine ligase [Chromatiales bacterium]|nr:UDP-N-acetylmuramoyl-tripeptide--D-alanyl-D-alanine ligase [Chromatiales bacterium]
MMHGTLSQVAGWAQGRLIGADVPVRGVSTDTRTLTPGALFVALRGPRHDAHDLTELARAAGAAALVVERRVSTALPQVVVDDTVQALGRLARAWRRRLELRVVALTGSNGKTTVKTLCASILEHVGPTWATRGNLNNHIGVPLTLLELGPEHRFAVVEMGANHPGEIAYLADLAGPDVALVNNAGPAHLEGFGSVAGVARAKGEIFGALQSGGVAVFNADDPHSAIWEALIKARTRMRFGFHPQAEVRGEDGPEAGLLHIASPQGPLQVRLRLSGRHNRLNALAATAAALAAGAPLEAVAKGLERVGPVPGRLTLLAARGGAWLLDDTYNANPASLAAGIEALCEGPGEPWLILGDMGELGAEAARLHEEAGRLAREAGVRRLFALGSLARHAATGFGAGAAHFEEMESLVRAVDEAIRGGERILVKGSRAMRMERVVARLRAAGAEGEPQHAA